MFPFFCQFFVCYPVRLYPILSCVSGPCLVFLLLQVPPQPRSDAKRYKTNEPFELSWTGYLVFTLGCLEQVHFDCLDNKSACVQTACECRAVPECQWKKDWPHLLLTSPPGSSHSYHPSCHPVPALSSATTQNTPYYMSHRVIYIPTV